jgi:hypothetical protein
VIVEVKILVRGPDGCRVEHLTAIEDEDHLERAIGTALNLYRKFYPDAAPFKKTVSIDHA